jgi:hypothetical protein
MTQRQIIQQCLCSLYRRGIDKVLTKIVDTVLPYTQGLSYVLLIVRPYTQGLSNVLLTVRLYFPRALVRTFYGLLFVLLTVRLYSPGSHTYFLQCAFKVPKGLQTYFLQCAFIDPGISYVFLTMSLYRNRALMRTSYCASL